jgi:hypothetical protein
MTPVAIRFTLIFIITNMLIHAVAIGLFFLLQPVRVPVAIWFLHLK